MEPAPSPKSEDALAHMDEEILTFLFTDVENSSQLWERDAAAMHVALARHDALLRNNFEAYDVLIVHPRGDGFMAVFGTADSAVSCALACQQAVLAENWDPALGPLRVRMGMHTGPAQKRADDYYGETVNRASRLGDAGHGGQILLSEVTKALVQDDLTPEIRFVDLGVYRLRHLSQPERVFQLDAPGLPTTFPPLRFLAVSSNLPSQPTPFIGRQTELERLAELLHDQAIRLVTLLGVGGIGKTRLALAAAESQLTADGRFPEGIYFVALAPLSHDEQIVPAIADALGYSFFADRPPQQQLLNFLRPSQMLLVLDNFEHLISEESIRLVGDILAAAPRVKLLVTSRTRLGVRGEHLLPLDGLEVPPDPWPFDGEEIGRRAGELDHADAYSAVQLFRESARRVRPEFSLTPENMASVIRICQLVEGMPLGIELAAAWAEILPVAEIAAELEGSLDFLEVDTLDLPERQRSLRAVFETSWQMLEQSEREALSRLTTFQGGFDRRAAQAVAEASPRVLLALVSKSWLQRSGGERYQIHELLRQYAGEKLRADPAAEETCRQRHGAHFAAWLEQLDRQMKGPGLQEAFAAIAADFDNIRAAWHWLVEQGEFELLVRQMLPAFFRYCEARVRSFDLLPLLEEARQALAAGGDEGTDGVLMAILLTAQGAFYRNGYPIRFEYFGLVVPAFEEMIRDAWQTATDPEAQEAMGVWAIVAIYVYGRVLEPELAIPHLSQIIPRFSGTARPWELAFGLGLLASLYMLDMRDEPTRQEAERCILEALAIFEELGDERESAYLLRELGQLRRLEHKFGEAIHYWQDAQARLRSLGEWAIAADIHWQIGDAYLQLGQPEEAFHHYREMSQEYLTRGYRAMASGIISKESYEALRYGTLSHARRRREESLALARAANDLFREAWSTWEMGELERVAGDYQAAVSWFERARELFARFGDQTGLAFYYRGLGDTALARGDYAEAQERFRASLKEAEETGHDWAKAYALSGLGRVATLQGEYEAAQGYLDQALALARSTREQGIIHAVLASMADLHAAKGETDRAIELAEQVINDPTAWNETKALATAVLAKLDDTQ